MASVYIPVQNSEEEVRVSLDQLPRDANDILDILKAEQAPLDLWLIIAREYFKQGKHEQFRQILEEGSGPEIDEYYGDVKYERIAILNALAAFYTYLGKIETKQSKKDEHFANATHCYNRATRIDRLEPSTWIGKGQLHVAKGDFSQARTLFKIPLDENPSNIPGLLGQGCVDFNMGENEINRDKKHQHYISSLNFYKKVLQIYPACPGFVRLGIGLCLYRLGRFEKARYAFERVLKLDPENIEAYVALGIMNLQTSEADGIRKGMEFMENAFEIYPYCTMALNYLANHFFFTGQHFLVEQLTETALAMGNHSLMKSHSYYNLARSYHSKGDFDKAGRYYMASVNEISKPQEFILPYYGLAQVQLKLGDFRSSLSNFEKVLEFYPENSDCLKAVGHIYEQLGQTVKSLETIRSRPSSGGMTPVSGLNGLNLSFPGNSRGRPHLSISPSHPTITLDLTVPELPSPASSQHTHQASRFPLMNLGSSSSRFYPSPFNHPSMESSTAPVSWSGGYLGYHGAQLFGGGNRDPFTLHNNGSGGHTTQESFYNRSNLQMMDNNKVQLPTSLPQNSLTDTISAATKAITSDPNFQSALAVTVATVLSGGSGRNNQESGDTLGLGLKREDYISSVLPYPPNWKNNLAAQRPSLAFSNQKKDNSSPPANRE